MRHSNDLEKFEFLENICGFLKPFFITVIVIWIALEFLF